MINRIKKYIRLVIILLFLLSTGYPLVAAKESDKNIELKPSSVQSGMDWIRTSKDGDRFVHSQSGNKFRVWGFNYDHDESGRLLEDYWIKEWFKVKEDFKEMKALGANAVRIHLQTAKFMKSEHKTDKQAFKQLARLVGLAQKIGLYLNITGLGCYHIKDVPDWYDKMNESERWNVQAQFWKMVAKTCAKSPAVFCYDLMNEPVLPGADKKETEWLLGEFGGKHFVQRITLDLKGRTRKQVAKDWIDTLVTAIRKQDDRHLITVGVIPWVHTFPKAKPLFYSEEVSRNLDFVSVHFYPKQGEVDKALTAFKAYNIGKPLVIEEIFPLKCGLDEVDEFIEDSWEFADGYFGFYWGKTIDEYAQEDDFVSALCKNWLEYFREKAQKETFLFD